jgi:hypothetical protein
MSVLPGRFGLILVREPIGQCELCSVPFYSTRDAVSHLQTAEHGDNVEWAREAREHQKRMLAVVHDPEFGDPEIEEHMRKVGKRMLAEGRWEVKPSEKAGFS